MANQKEMDNTHSGPVDVLPKLDWYASVLGKIGSPEQAADLAKVRAAVVVLIEEGKKLLPRNLCLNNSRWPDSTEIPLTTTLGELRSFAAALANVGGAK